MRWQRLVVAFRGISGCGAALSGWSEPLVGRDTDCPSPLIEGVKYVRFAELDPHGPATGALGVVPLEVSIDAQERDLDGHSPVGPAQNLLECRTNDSNEVAIGLATQIRFNRPAVLVSRLYNHLTSPDLTLCVPAATLTINAPSSSMFSARPTCRVPADSHSTRRPSIEAARLRQASTT